MIVAKPIIDILIGVKTFELNSSVTNNLIELGYEGFGEIGVGRLYFGGGKNILLILLSSGPREPLRLISPARTNMLFYSIFNRLIDFLIGREQLSCGDSEYSSLFWS